MIREKYSISVGSVKIKGLRGGAVTEIASFLEDMDKAYNALYQFERNIKLLDIKRRHMTRYDREYFKFNIYSFINVINQNYNEKSILPEYQLELKKVSIQSPGVWEFVGSLNPLQQIREYLNDKHERRKDKEYRESSDREKRKLDNEILKRVILEKDNAILRERIVMMKEVGMSEEVISQYIWEQLGPPLSKLGQHQDSGLIEAGEKRKLKFERNKEY